MITTYVGMKIDFSFPQLKKENAAIVVMEVGRNTVLNAMEEANEFFEEEETFCL